MSPLSDAPEPGISGCTASCGRNQDGGHWHFLDSRHVWAQYPRRIVRPAAPDTTGELREAVAEALWHAQPEYCVSPWDEISEKTQEQFRAKTDAVIALPAFRALIAERDTAVAQVQAVRELAEEISRHARALVERPGQMPAFHGRQITILAAALRRALDGAATTGGGE